MTEMVTGTGPLHREASQESDALWRRVIQVSLVMGVGALVVLVVAHAVGAHALAQIPRVIVALCACVAAAAAAARSKGHERALWVEVSLAALLASVAAALWALELAGAINTGEPCVGDLAELAAMVLLALASVGFVGLPGSTAALRARSALDVVCLALTIWLISLVGYVLPWYRAFPDSGPFVRVTASVFATAGVITAGCGVAMLLIGSPSRRPTDRRLAALLVMLGMSAAAWPLWLIANDAHHVATASVREGLAVVGWCGLASVASVRAIGLVEPLKVPQGRFDVIASDSRFANIVPYGLVVVVPGALLLGLRTVWSFDLIVAMTAVAAVIGILVVVRAAFGPLGTGRSSIDTATGLPDRATFSGRVRDLLRDESAPVAIIVLDIDDVRGTGNAGYRYLSRIGSEARAIAGQNGCIGRIGPDEIAVAIRGADVSAAKEIGADLRRTVGSIERPDGTPLTACWGIACGFGSSIDAEGLLVSAHVACERAKVGGPDRVSTRDAGGGAETTAWEPSPAFI